MELTKELQGFLQTEWDKHIEKVQNARNPKQAGDLVDRAVRWAASVVQTYGDVVGPRDVLLDQVKQALAFEVREDLLEDALQEAWSEGSLVRLSEEKLEKRASEAWKYSLAYTSTGKVVTSLGNLIMILQNDPAWKGKLYYDSLLQLPFVHDGTPLDEIATEVRSSDFMRRSQAESMYKDAFQLPRLALNPEANGHIAIWLQREYGVTVSQEKTISQAVVAAAMGTKINHALSWAESLNWDGKHRLVNPDDLEAGISEFARCFHDDERYMRRIVTPFLRIFMLSYIARLYQPGCKVDTMLVLEGFQGARKSTSMSLLVPNQAYFSDSPMEWGSKDSLQFGIGLLIYEVAEVDRLLAKRNTANFKAWLRSRSDRFRPPYSADVRIFPRTFVPYGTVNAEGAWLKDYGKQRALMPLLIERVIDTDWIAHNREQLVAEAIALLKAGWAYWPSADEAETIAIEMETRLLPNIFTEALEETLKNYGLEFVRTGEVANLMQLTGEDPRISDTFAHAFRQLGWRYTKFKREDGQVWQGWKAPDNWKVKVPPGWSTTEPPIKGCLANPAGLQRRLSLQQTEKSKQTARARVYRLPLRSFTQES